MVRSIVLAFVLAACDGATTSTTDTTGDSGTEPTTTSAVQEDVFTQLPIDPVDMVWVLDPNWEVGYDNLQNVRQQGYETLLLADSDWKMGFTSSDVQNPANRGVIRGIHQTVFPDAGTWDRPRGDDISRPIDAIISMLDERGESNEAFYREGGHVHIMIMTDNRDRSASTLEELQAEFARQIEDNLTLSFRVSAIVRGSEDLVADWRRITDALGGTTYVTGSWERGITDIYNHGVNRRREFPLTQDPTAAPRQVIVRFREQNQVFEIGQGVDYIATRNVVRFIEEPPEVGSTIRVSYPVEGF